MNTVRKYLLLTMLMAATAFACIAESPAEVIGKATAKINASRGMAGHFRASGSGGDISGTFRFDGRRSFMEVPSVSTTWYDGKTLWTLNARNKEVTVSIPEPQELREINPLLYIRNVNNDYRLFFSKRKEKGRYLVLLNPRNTKTGIKAVEVAVNASTYAIERLIIRDSDDNVSTLNLSNVSYTRRFLDSDFTYPAEKYKGYELIDLR